MMKYFSLLLLTCSLGLSQQAWAQTKLQTQLSWYDNKAFEVYRNPALAVGRYDSSHAEVKASFINKNADQALVAQMGRAFMAGRFNASSYQWLGKHAVVWGDAGYDRRRTRDIQWNESADFMQIYPYVTADTLGGKMEREAYRFHMGYASQLNRWCYGVEAAYESALSYRDIDPRPRNNSLFVDLKVGVSHSLGTRYNLGAYALWQRYSQEQSIAFMNPLGAITLYQMQGLGMHYYRFAGALKEAYFTGHTLGAGFTLQPRDKGLLAQLELSRRVLQKQMSDLQDAPINDLTVWTISGETAWRGRQHHVSLSATYSNHEGAERLYDNGLTGYKQLAINYPFLAKTLHMQLEAAQQWLSARWEINAMPTVSLLAFQETYANPQREMQFANLSFGLQTQAIRSFRAGIFTAHIAVQRTQNIQKRLVLNDRHAFTEPLSMLNDNYNQLTAHAWTSEIGARYDLFLRTPSIKTLFLQATLRHQNRTTHHHTTLVQLSLGVTL